MLWPLVKFEGWGKSSCHWLPVARVLLPAVKLYQWPDHFSQKSNFTSGQITSLRSQTLPVARALPPALKLYTEPDLRKPCGKPLQSRSFESRPGSSLQFREQAYEFGSQQVTENIVLVARALLPAVKLYQWPEYFSQQSNFTSGQSTSPSSQTLPVARALLPAVKLYQ